MKYLTNDVEAAQIREYRIIHFANLVLRKRLAQRGQEEGGAASRKNNLVDPMSGTNFVTHRSDGAVADSRCVRAKRRQINFPPSKSKAALK